MPKKNGSRRAEISRQTKETKVRVELESRRHGPYRNLHWASVFSITCSICWDVTLQLDRRPVRPPPRAILEVDSHHTVEDVGIVIGQAIEEALGDKRGINRYGWAIVPMDESLAQVALDLSGRPAFVFKVDFNDGAIGSFPTELVEEFFKSLATNAKMNLHIQVPYGGNNHHIAEAIFKATARALRLAIAHDPRNNDEVPSTKGSL